MDASPPGFSVHGIFQTRIPEWFPIPTPGDLPDPGIELMSPVSPAMQTDSLPTEPSGKPRLVLRRCYKEQPHVNGVRFANSLRRGGSSLPPPLQNRDWKNRNFWTLQQSTKSVASQEKLMGKHCKAALLKCINYWDYLQASLRSPYLLNLNQCLTPEMWKRFAEWMNEL